MKPFSILLMLTFSLCASLCCPGEEEATQFNISNDNLVQIENNATVFAVDDFLVIETIIPNNQTTVDGQTIQLSNLFYDDVLSESFLEHSLSLYLETQFGTRSPIQLTEEVVFADEGMVNLSNEIIRVLQGYDEASNSFRSRIRIQLKESGTLFLGGRGSFAQSNAIEIYGGIYELGFANISTTIRNANAQGLYEFVVE
ncbi:hypothetical protein Q2T40_10775 [Winogradskyella maritima]|uniref:YceI-like domain-containing protein n=1 Tax=Winogradskyella maritima TaxID=1517766 RepID=A0ABV8AJ42_9FLAO|nr:hypothetical protein [Winogradskyella maritima]